MRHIRRALVIGSMVLAVAFVALLAFLDGARESQAALDDFAEEQATVAASVAVDLTARLEALARAARLIAQLADTQGAPGTFGDLYAVRLTTGREPATGAPAEGDGLVLQVPLAEGRVVEFIAPARKILSGLQRIERPGALVVLVRPPSLRQLHRPDGTALVDELILSALERGDHLVRVPAERAAALGLPVRTALAGLARVDAGVLGRWGVAVVATAGRERDRERRASYRLVLALLVAGGLVLLFGGLALREQSKELRLARQLAEREREERLEREAKAATMVTLASGVAHEISTPLGVIVGRAEQLVERAGADERFSKGAAIILEQAESIRQVIRGFLGMARGANPQLGRVEPAQVVEAARALVAHRFEKAGVALAVSVEPALPAVRCDLRLLEHAVVNLLLNACDASAAGKTVLLSARANESFVAFVVDDEGTGIDPGVAARASEPFFTTKQADQGTGLGLAIASEIAKSHRGSLTIQPRQGKRGTTAQVAIPFAPEAAHG